MEESVERDRWWRYHPYRRTAGPAARLGFSKGMVVQELGWDSDTDDDLRVAIEDAIDSDMVDGDYGNVVDAVVLWWRDEDGDLVDGLVDSLTDLVGGGAIWLLTPKVGRPNAVDPADITEAAPIAGLALTTTAAVSKDWAATRLVTPKSPRVTSRGARPVVIRSSAGPLGLAGTVGTPARVLGGSGHPAPALRRGPRPHRQGRQGVGDRPGGRLHRDGVA